MNIVAQPIRLTNGFTWKILSYYIKILEALNSLSRIAIVATVTALFRPEQKKKLK